jgi:hypothetical protein
VCLSFSPSISTCRGGTLTGLCPHGDGGCISTGAPGPIAMGVGVARCTSRPLVAVGRVDATRARRRWQRFAGLQIPRLRRRSTRRPAAGPRAHPSPLLKANARMLDPDCGHVAAIAEVSASWSADGDRAHERTGHQLARCQLVAASRLLRSSAFRGCYSLVVP